MKFDIIIRKMLLQNSTALKLGPHLVRLSTSKFVFELGYTYSPSETTPNNTTALWLIESNTLSNAMRAPDPEGLGTFMLNKVPKIAFQNPYGTR